MKEGILFFIFWFLQFLFLCSAIPENSLPDIYCPCLPPHKCSSDDQPILQKIRQLLPKCKDENFVRCCPLLQNHEKFAKEQKLPDILHKISQQMGQLNFSENHREIFNYFLQAKIDNKPTVNKNNSSQDPTLVSKKSDSPQNLENINEQNNDLFIEKDKENNDTKEIVRHSNDFKIATSFSQELNYSNKPFSKYFTFQDNRASIKVKDEERKSSLENVGANILENVKKVMISMAADSNFEKNILDTRDNIKSPEINYNKQTEATRPTKIDLKNIPEYIIPPINFSYPEYVGYTRNFEESSTVLQGGSILHSNPKYNSHPFDNRKKVTKENIKIIPNVNVDDSPYLLQLIRRALNFESLRLHAKGRSLHSHTWEEEIQRWSSNEKKPCTITPLMIKIIDRLRSKLEESRQNRITTSDLISDTQNNLNPNSKIKRMSNNINKDETLNLERPLIREKSNKADEQSKYEEYVLQPDFPLELKSSLELSTEKIEKSNFENETDGLLIRQQKNDTDKTNDMDKKEILVTEMLSKVVPKGESEFFERKGNSSEQKKLPETVHRIPVEPASENLLKLNEKGELNLDNDTKVHEKNSANNKKTILRANIEGIKRLQNQNSKLNNYLKGKTAERRLPVGVNRNFAKTDVNGINKIKELINKKKSISAEKRQYPKPQLPRKIGQNKKINGTINNYENIPRKIEQNKKVNETINNYENIPRKIEQNKEINGTVNNYENNKNLTTDPIINLSTKNSSSVTDFSKKDPSFSSAKGLRNFNKNSTKVEVKGHVETSTKTVPIRTFKAPPRTLPKKNTENKNRNQTSIQLREKPKWFSRLNNSRPIFRNSDNRNRTKFIHINRRKNGSTNLNVNINNSINVINSDVKNDIIINNTMIDKIKLNDTIRKSIESEDNVQTNLKIIKNPENVTTENSTTNYLDVENSKLSDANESSTSRSTTISEQAIAPFNTVSEQILETRDREGFANDHVVGVNVETKMLIEATRPNKIDTAKSILQNTAEIPAPKIKNKTILKSYVNSDIFRGNKTRENERTDRTDNEENTKNIKEDNEKTEENKEKDNEDRSNKLQSEIVGRNIDDTAKKIVKYFGTSFDGSDGRADVSKNFDSKDTIDQERLKDKRWTEQKENNNEKDTKTFLSDREVNKMKKKIETFNVIKSTLLGPSKMLIIN